VTILGAAFHGFRFHAVTVTAAHIVDRTIVIVTIRAFAFHTNTIAIIVFIDADVFLKTGEAIGAHAISGLTFAPGLIILNRARSVRGAGHPYAR